MEFCRTQCKKLFIFKFYYFKKQTEMARNFINREMGQDARAQSVSEVSLNLTKEEMQAAKDRFNQLDRDRKGHITVNDIRRHFRVIKKKFILLSVIGEKSLKLKLKKFNEEIHHKIDG